MQVLVNADHHIKGGESVMQRVESVVIGAVDRFAARLTRVEVHLNDVNGPKHGDREKRCMMEARVGGLRPIAVKHQAPTLLEAIEGAADKLERALDHTLGRLQALTIRNPRDMDSLEPRTSNALNGADGLDHADSMDPADGMEHTDGFDAAEAAFWEAVERSARRRRTH